MLKYIFSSYIYSLALKFVLERYPQTNLNASSSIFLTLEINLIHDPYP
jgi:hypothetical protein